MTSVTTLKVGVVGASGFAGAELMRLCSAHPMFDIGFAAGRSSAGSLVGDVFPSLRGAYPEMVIASVDEIPRDLDVIFLALPHGVSQGLVPNLDSQLIVDLGADYRFDDLAIYEKWYGSAHEDPGGAEEFTYGLVELFRTQIAGADRISVPGCYVTASVLAMAPLLEAGAASHDGVIVDAMSGVSGAGREPKPSTSFATVAENMTAYGLLGHRHTPEMEMALSRYPGRSAKLLFTPHLVPSSRGILATCYLDPLGDQSTSELLQILETTYEAEPFVTVTHEIPATKATLGSNSVHITVRRDDRTNRIVVISALDNLVKGAAGQAIQCANLSLGLDETMGLAVAGVYP